MLEDWIRILWAPVIFAFTILATIAAMAYQSRMTRHRSFSHAPAKVDSRPAYRVNIDLMHHESNYPPR